MPKNFWILVIVFTLILLKVTNNPKQSFAIDPNTKEAQNTELQSIAEPNQIEVNIEKNTHLDTPDANDNSIKELNKAEDGISEKAAPNQILPEKEPDNESKIAKTKETTENLSQIQSRLQKEFSAIFVDYVGPQGKVDYSRLRRQRLVLRTITTLIENLKPNEYNKWPKEDKIAFWINTYNLHKLKAITENYPIEGSRWLNPIWGANSIRHIKKQLDTYKFLAMHEEFTFDEVENRFFKDLFKEPRVFFAITMGTKSSPPMLNVPYQGSKLYQQLDDQTRRFLVNENIGFKADEENKIVYLSLILKPGWYGDQFTEKYSTDKMFKDKTLPEIRAILNFVADYIPQNNVSFLKIGTYSVSYLAYNWQLDE